jgi:hypothetical protein
MSQTVWQHTSSLQAGVPLGSRQSPARGSPQSPPVVEQENPAKKTQFPSHDPWQQYGSMRQTTEQHSASSQEGLACGLKHDPLADAPQSPMQDASAVVTQLPSHSLQQNGSRAQTFSQQL